MKKHVISLAILSAFAAPAMAQNVTIGGNFDVSYDLGTQNTQTKQFNTAGAVTTSALTIGGVEDLGGGLQFYFNINSRLGAGGQVEGAVGSTQALNENVGERAGAINFGDRGFQIGLRGAFGDIAIGKTTGTAIGGTIRGGVAGNLSLLSESLWGDRPNHMISYTTPRVNGLAGRAIYQVSGGYDGATNTANASGSYELSVNYANGPLTLDVAYNDVKNAVYTGSTQGSTATIAGNDMGARLQYNFGPAALNVSYLKNETAAAAERRQMSLGLTVPMGNTTLIAEAGKRDAAANVGDGFYNIGAVYNLSKRTNVYAFLAKVNDAVAAARSLQFDAEVQDETAEKPRYLVGVRHSF